MSHHHDHHHHSHDHSAEMSMEEKLAKLLSHWLQHNEEHAKSYELWAQRATSHGMAEVGALIEKAAEKTKAMDEDFKAAIEALTP
jgi:RNA:NAD 2'-phosphotransferase (TPT1/KptA family)